MIAVAWIAAAEAASPDLTLRHAWRAELAAPARVSVGPHGEVVVTDPPRQQVVVRDREGRLKARWTVAADPIGVAVDATGVWVGERGTGAVRHHTLAGVVDNALGIGDGEFGLPSDLAIDPATGAVWVADTLRGQISAYDATGYRRVVFDGGRDDRIELPTGVWVSNDTVWVVDQRTRQVRAFDKEGHATGAFGAHGAEPGELYMPQGVWGDGAGRLYVVDARLARLAAFDLTGAWLGEVGAYGTAPGQLRQPTDVAGDADGRLFVASTGNGRLEVWARDGFADPERYVPAGVSVEPAALVRGTPGVAVFVRVEVEGARLEHLSGLSINGLALSDVVAEDRDKDGVDEAVGWVDAAALLGTLPDDGAGTVQVRGTAGGLTIDEAVAFVVTSVPDTDDTDDTDADTDSDTAPAPPDRRCGCATPAPPSALLGLFALAWLARRRR